MIAVAIPAAMLESTIDKKIEKVTERIKNLEDLVTYLKNENKKLEDKVNALKMKLDCTHG